MTAPLPLEIQVQKSRKPLRCPAHHCFGLMMINARRHCFQSLQGTARTIGLPFAVVVRGSALQDNLLAEGQIVEGNLSSTAGRMIAKSIISGHDQVGLGTGEAQLRTDSAR